MVHGVVKNPRFQHGILGGIPNSQHIQWVNGYYTVKPTVDIDPFTTSIWSEWLYRDCDPQILEIAEQPQCDLYLLLDVDIPRVSDFVCILSERRKEFFERCKSPLQEYVGRTGKSICSHSRELRRTVATGSSDYC